MSATCWHSSHAGAAVGTVDVSGACLHSSHVGAAVGTVEVSGACLHSWMDLALRNLGIGQKSCAMGLAVELWTCPQLVLVVARATWNLVLAQLTVTLMAATMVVHDDHGDDDDDADDDDEEG